MTPSDPGADASLLEIVARLASAHIVRRRDDEVAPPIDANALAGRLAAYDFAAPRDAASVAADLFDLLRGAGVRSDHPGYFGLFNPPALVPAIAGDLIVATVNPQLAVWSHAAAAAEIERKLVALFADRIWPGAASAGNFTSGGSEANHSAVLVALARRYAGWATGGLPRDRRPVIYVSAEAHLAWIKIARATGLGDSAVRLVKAEDGLSLSGSALRRAIDADADTDPLMLVATAGATAHGAVDDLRGFAEVGETLGVHVHIDAAWAGGALLDPSRAGLFDGIAGADTVTIDPHKWLAVPMGAGLFLSRARAGLNTAFGVSTGYMPAAMGDHEDPYVHSMQWSRRFIGGKLFMALATLGLEGYRAIIARQFALGDRLRDGLRAHGWAIVNDTRLPLICFAPRPGDDEIVRRIAADTVATGRHWLSTVAMRGQVVLRACITGFETDEHDIDALIATVTEIRDRPTG